MPAVTPKQAYSRDRGPKRQAPWRFFGARRQARWVVAGASARLSSLRAQAQAWAESVPVLAAVFGRARAVLDVITPLGRWALAALLLALPAAALTSWNELWALVVVLAVLLVTALPTVVGRRTYQVEVALASGRVTAGDSAVGEVKVANPGSRAVKASTIELPVGAGEAEFRVPRLTAKAVHTEVFTIPTQRRGVIVVGPVSSVRGDPVGALRRRQRWNRPIELYVHPRTVRMEAEAIGFIRDIEGAVTQDLSSSDVSFHALRDYVPGDDRRNVHWRSTARTGHLMVRQFEETRRAHLLVVLDLDDTAWGSEDEFETGVSCAASLILAAHRAERELSLVTQEGSLVLPNAVRALDTVTAVEMAPTRVSLPALARQAANDVSQASVVVVVTGSNISAELFHRAHLELPGSAYTVGLRVEPAAAPGSTQIGRMRLLTVDTLDSLPLIIRRAA